MSRRIFRRDKAREDLVEHYRYLAERSPDIADRFLKAAELTLADLTENPYLGGAYPTDNPGLANVRCFRVSRTFRDYLVFYRPVNDGIEVVPVLHGAQDVTSILRLE